MNRAIALLLIATLAGSALAIESGEKRIKTAMVMSSVLPGAGQFYLGNVGKGFFALGTELCWWGGAGLFFLGGKLMADEAARLRPDPRADSLQTGSTVFYVGSGLFGAVALGWRALMVSDVHDDAVARDYRDRFLGVRLGLAPQSGGLKVGLYRRF